MNIQEFLNLKTGDRIIDNIDDEEIIVTRDNNKINLKYNDFKSECIIVNFTIGSGYRFDWICRHNEKQVWREVITQPYLEAMIEKFNVIKISNQEILNLSVSTFSKEDHYRQLNEEIGEFNVALSHYFRNRCGIESVIEEIADVKQMLDTWMLILKISKEDYEKVENEKYQKLLRQINEFKQKSETNFRKLIEEQKLKGEI